MSKLLAEILLAPVLVGCSSAGSRRWGARAGGLISAFPAVVGPVLLIIAQERGDAFAARAANGTMLGLASLAAFAVTYGWAASRARWRLSLGLAWASAGLVATVLGWLAGGLGFPTGLCIAIVSLTLAYAAMPPNASGMQQRRGLARVQSAAAGMVLTAVLVAVLAAMTVLVGPMIGGMLAALPVLASVLAVFTHEHEGSQAVVELLRGMLAGMAGFVGFCAVIAVLIVPAGPILAFACASTTAIALQVFPLLSPVLRQPVRV